jgi:MFS family permease
MLIIFMFLCGVAGSSAATNVAGSIADMFGDIDGAGQAMALFVISANAGPSMGAPLGNWISNNPKMGLKWIFLVNSIIGAGFTVACAFIPETLPRIMIAIGANGELNEGGVDDYEARVLNTKILFAPEMKFMIKTTFELLVTEPIIWVLAFYNGCTYGLLFLYLAGIHQVFVINNHLS